MRNHQNILFRLSTTAATVATLVAAALFVAPPALAEEQPKPEIQAAQVAAAPPSAQAETPVESAPRVAQVAAENPSAPAESLGDNRPATLGDINRLDGKIDNLSATIDSNFRWTLALIIALLGLPQLPGWFRAFRGAPTAAAALLAASLFLASPAWAATSRGEAALVLLIILLIAVYGLPWFLAGSRGHPESGAIGWLNLFLGWTGVVWVILFLWAVLPSTEKVREMDRAGHQERKKKAADKAISGKYASESEIGAP